jgi:phage recombination protein Bet
MTQQLSKIEPAAIAEWDTNEHLKLLKETMAKNATQAEFDLFLYTARKYGLDPLVKQIWCVKFGSSPAAIYCGRDGFLAIAHRSGQLDGMETTAIRNDKGELVAAQCKVWRRDMQHPFVVEVALSEYKSNNNPNWNNRPETMLKKVAESQCLRRAFSISGMYEPGEMDNNDYEPQPALPQPKAQPARIVSIVPDTETKPEQEPESATDQQISAIRKLVSRLGIDEDKLNNQTQELYGAKLDYLTKSEAGQFIKVLQGQA